MITVSISTGLKASIADWIYGNQPMLCAKRAQAVSSVQFRMASATSLFHFQQDGRSRCWAISVQIDHGAERTQGILHPLHDVGEG